MLSYVSQCQLHLRAGQRGKKQDISSCCLHCCCCLVAVTGPHTAHSRMQVQTLQYHTTAAASFGLRGPSSTPTAQYPVQSLAISQLPWTKTQFNTNTVVQEHQQPSACAQLLHGRTNAAKFYFLPCCWRAAALAAFFSATYLSYSLAQMIGFSPTCSSSRMAAGQWQ